MRTITAALLCLAAAGCSGSGDEKKPAGPPAQLPAGTWQVASEVTEFRSTDGTTPVVSAKVGEKANATVCVDKAGDQPAPALFAATGEECTYKSAYIKDGTINAGLECHRKGVPGYIMTSLEGTYSEKGLDAVARTTSYLSVRGGFQMSRKLTATVKPGACTPAPAAASDDDDDGDEGNAA